MQIEKIGDDSMGKGHYHGGSPRLIMGLYDEVQPD